MSALSPSIFVRRWSLTFVLLLFLYTTALCLNNLGDLRRLFRNATVLSLFIFLDLGLLRLLVIPIALRLGGQHFFRLFCFYFHEDIGNWVLPV